MRTLINIKICTIFATLITLCLSQTCSTSTNQTDCQNKGSCLWTTNTAKSQCLNIDLQCSAKTESQCTSGCQLSGSQGTCVQISNLGCSALTNAQCTQNSKCIINSSSACVDRDYQCGSNTITSCLTQANICYWQEKVAGTCVNTVSCSGKTQTQCNSQSTSCYWFVGGTCSDQNVVVNVSTNGQLINFSYLMLGSLLLIITL